MLSKSKYCAFVQCPRNLWLKTYRPELATPDNSLEARMEAGNEIGDLAMQLFGDFVEVSAYKDNGKIYLSEMIARTNDPALDYHNLEGVHNGGEAMELFPKIKDLPIDEQAVARHNLLKYCELDTYAMVKVWEELVRVTK